MGEKKTEKKTTRAKKQSRSKNEICLENAEKLVSKSETFLKNAQNLKDKINSLGGGDFSKMAIGFNNLVSEAIETLEQMPFATTEREEMVSTTSSGKSFADYQTPKEETETQSD